ncbi:DUF3570 domain-containing protein [Shewanella algae]|uniref:DUF3570 domain-containing protein n=1 Tax=Shewanella algae TaxID=38313 RepID=UPI001182F0AA|nr:DUF3570 domain-containing protein [Shewanella algae]
MQLKRQKGETNIAAALTLASSSLLTSGATYAADNNLSFPDNSADKATDWQLEAALMFYGEQDRVTTLEGVLLAKGEFDDSSGLDIKLVFDSLSGASATGAVVQQQSQTLTRPSGNGEYQIAAGEQVLDDSFDDKRLQLSAAWYKLFENNWQLAGGVYGSREYDYTSLGVNGALEHSFNKNNSTASLALAYGLDTIDPVGGRPLPLATMARRVDYDSEAAFRQAFEASREGGSDHKQTLDLLLGFTQVLNRRWLLQGNYGFSLVKGYQTDPYKVLSLVNNLGVTQSYLYESRPDSRQKQSLFLLLKGALDRGVLDLSWRYTFDDWQLDSHTLESHFRHYFSDGFYGQLHLRYYRQSAASFYRPLLLQNEGSISGYSAEFASADHRLGELQAYTVGVKLGHKLGEGRELSYRLEYYQQQSENNGTLLPGELGNMQLFPRLRAVIAQLSYRF